jgi:hypothetical protein
MKQGGCSDERQRFQKQPEMDLRIRSYHALSAKNHFRSFKNRARLASLWSLLRVHLGLSFGGDGMNDMRLITTFENALFSYWKLLPEPKKKYTEWYYGHGGVRDAIENWQVPKRAEEDK